MSRPNLSSWNTTILLLQQRAPTNARVLRRHALTNSRKSKITKRTQLSSVDSSSYRFLPCRSKGLFSPCVTYNHDNTYQWFRPRVKKLEEDSTYDPADWIGAMEKSLLWVRKSPSENSS